MGPPPICRRTEDIRASSPSEAMSSAVITAERRNPQSFDEGVDGKEEGELGQVHYRWDTLHATRLQNRAIDILRVTMGCAAGSEAQRG
jgi:hypothetical protein